MQGGWRVGRGGDGGRKVGSEGGLSLVYFCCCCVSFSYFEHAGLINFHNHIPNRTMAKASSASFNRIPISVDPWQVTCHFRGISLYHKLHDCSFNFLFHASLSACPTSLMIYVTSAFLSSSFDSKKRTKEINYLIADKLIRNRQQTKLCLSYMLLRCCLYGYRMALHTNENNWILLTHKPKSHSFEKYGHFSTLTILIA